jgi:hypothetical protein
MLMANDTSGCLAQVHAKPALTLSLQRPPGQERRAGRACPSPSGRGASGDRRGPAYQWTPREQNELAFDKKKKEKLQIQVWVPRPGNLTAAEPPGTGEIIGPCVEIAQRSDQGNPHRNRR